MVDIIGTMKQRRSTKYG